MDEKLSTLLLGMIRSKHDDDKFISKFNRTYKKCSKTDVFYNVVTYKKSNKSDKRDINYYLSLFLHAATKDNNAELITTLLTDVRLDFSSAVNFKQKLFFMVIHSGNHELVDIFLRAGISSHEKLSIPLAFEHKTPSHDFSRTIDCVELSPFEYACLLDQRGILKLLVSFDNMRRKKTYEVFLFCL